jgi:hypothetical protein
MFLAALGRGCSTSLEGCVSIGYTQTSHCVHRATPIIAYEALPLSCPEVALRWTGRWGPLRDLSVEDMAVEGRRFPRSTL